MSSLSKLCGCWFVVLRKPRAESWKAFAGLGASSLLVYASVLSADGVSRTWHPSGVSTDSGSRKTMSCHLRLSAEPVGLSLLCGSGPAERASAGQPNLTVVVSQSGEPQEELLLLFL